MSESLKERALSYENAYNVFLTRRLPLIICLNGRGFRKTLSLVAKPHSPEYTEVLSKTLIKLASDIEGCHMIYSFNDEIIIVCRNDQSLGTEAWYDNNLQKIVSVSSSLASVAFSRIARDANLPLVGEPVFLAKAFVLPSLTETINYLIYQQHRASGIAVHNLCQYFLSSKYGAQIAKQNLEFKTDDEKYDLLVRELKVDPKNYPKSFWKGIACYRSPKKTKNAYGQEEVRNKLTINHDLPTFSKDQDFVFDIIDPDIK